jgi:hypothetical protein
LSHRRPNRLVFVVAVVVVVGCEAACSKPTTTEIVCGNERDIIAGPSVRWFEDVTAPSGVLAVDTGIPREPYGQEQFQGSGAAVADLDGDGRPDIVIAQGASAPTLVWRNLGDFHFAAVAPDLPAAIGVALADLDNDGRPDLVLSDGSGLTVYANAGDCTFAARARFAHDALIQGVLPADLDGDGALDLYALAFAAPFARSFLLVNQGNFTFAAAPDAVGVASLGLAWTAAWADFDGDGHGELYVADDALVRSSASGALERRDQPPDRFFRAHGTAAFSDDATVAGLAVPRSSMGAIVADFDDDGALDLLVTTVGAKALLRNRGDGTFVDVAATAGVQTMQLQNARCPRGTVDWSCLDTGWGAALVDVDRDGFDDLVIANGALSEPKAQPATALRGGPDHRFSPVAAGLGCLDGRSVIPADFDGDGGVDLLITQYHAPARLFRNVAGGQPWSRLRFRGRRSNRDGRGVVVTAVYRSGRRLTRVVAAGGIANGSAPPELQLTNGSDAIVALELRWPAGAMQNLPPPAPVAISELVEP